MTEAQIRGLQRDLNGFTNHDQAPAKDAAIVVQCRMSLIKKSTDQKFDTFLGRGDPFRLEPLTL